MQNSFDNNKFVQFQEEKDFDKMGNFEAKFKYEKKIYPFANVVENKKV